MEKTRLLGPVQAIAWNADCSSVAVSHCDSNVVIYEASSGPSSSGGAIFWRKVATLEGHHQLVSGLDWAPKSDLILSCSHDRNAFVWTRTATPGPFGAAGTVTTPPPPSRSATTASPATAGRPGSVGGGRFGGASRPGTTSASGSGEGSSSTSGLGSGGWEKQMVITRLTKGALCVRWSSSEAKFAIGSAARIVSVGYYDPESKWWACKLIRKAHESSVVSVAWHPNSVLLATGSTDRKVRLFNAYVPGYEPEAAPGAVPPNTNFGECLFEVAHEGCGWVHSVAWTRGDDALLYASHDGAIGYMRGPQAHVAVQLSASNLLPLKCLEVVSERVAVGAGWEGNLVVLTRQSEKDVWQQTAVLGSSRDGSSGGGSSRSGGGMSSGDAGPTTPVTPGVVRQLAQMHMGTGSVVTSGGGARGSGAPGPSTQQCCHTGCVTGLHARRGPAANRGPGPRWHVASAGLDGQVVLWDLSNFLYNL